MLPSITLWRNLMPFAEIDVKEKVVAEEATDVTEPSMYKVLLHNDDKTTFDFVVALLTIVFHMDSADAQGVTLDVHTQGRGIAGVYTREVAEEKVEESTKFARSSGFPLQISFEPQ